MAPAVAVPQSRTKPLERSLRRLITTWRPDIGVLNDYSHRQFAEMMSHYYLPRWEMYFRDRRAELGGAEIAGDEVVREVNTNNGDAVEHVTTRNKDMETFELKFATSTDTPLLRKPKGDIMKLAAKILATDKKESKGQTKKR